MSPLLNRARAALWPPYTEYWGLSIGAQEIVACQLRRQVGAWQVTTVNAEATPLRLYKDTPAADAVQQLVPVIARVAAGAAGKCIPLSVVIPDPVVSMAILELETLPKTVADREAMARWHLQKLGSPDTTLACVAQDLGMSDDKHLLLASAVSRVWLDCLLGACYAANVVPTIWQSAIAYRFNRFQEQLLREGQDGALLTIDSASWSLLLWDQSGRARHLRSRWRDLASGNEAETIAVEAERAVRAYVHGGRGRRLGTVHIIGDSDIANRVVALLEARMQNACARLSPLSDMEMADGVSLRTVDAALAITAALGNEG